MEIESIISIIISVLSLSVAVTSLCLHFWGCRTKISCKNAYWVYGKDKCKVIIILSNETNLPISVHSADFYQCGKHVCTSYINPIMLVGYESKKIAFAVSGLEKLKADSSCPCTVIFHASRGRKKQLTKTFTFSDYLPESAEPHMLPQVKESMPPEKNQNQS